MAIIVDHERVEVVLLEPLRLDVTGWSEAPCPEGQIADGQDRYQCDEGKDEFHMSSLLKGLERFQGASANRFVVDDFT
jgi:hypothetical protein